MITPEEIREKAKKLYARAVRAWLEEDESFFPYLVRASKKINGDVVAAAESVQRLRDGSKQVLGYGYTVEWEAWRSRTYGRNERPRKILFETREDLLRLIGRQQDFQRFSSSVMRLRHEFPQRLESWFPANISLLTGCAADIEGLIAVVHYFVNHPRPNRFARELPIEVDTKFIERHQRILQQWFDQILPAHAIRADETQFERRYGLRDKEPFLILRCLDLEVQQQLGVPYAEMALPLPTLASLSPTSVVVFIMENRTTLRTFPAYPRGIALEGRGRAVTELRDVPWLHGNAVYYWGDLDAEGFQILSSLRRIFPHTRSLLMDADTLEAVWHLKATGSGRAVPLLDNLTSAENSAFLRCQAENLRIEQEHLPQSVVEAALAGLDRASLELDGWPAVP